MAHLRVSILCFSMLLLFLSMRAAGQDKEPHKQGALKQRLAFWKNNRFDKEGRYHGRWKVYLGDDKRLIRNGRFQHGVEVGKWKYYYPGGTLYMLEKYNRRDNSIQVSKYYENGSLARTGTARIIRSTSKDHYYWFGEWQVYDEQGTFSHTETYKEGNLVSSTKK